MNSVAGPIVVEAKDSPQECERACAAAFARKESAVIDEMGRRAVPADDAAQLHPGKQVTSGRIQPDCNLAGGPIDRVGKPVRRVSIDPSVEIDERRVAECTRWRSAYDPDGHRRLAIGNGDGRGRGCLALGVRGGQDRPTGATDRQEYEHEKAHANGSRDGPSKSSARLPPAVLHRGAHAADLARSRCSSEPSVCTTRHRSAAATQRRLASLQARGAGADRRAHCAVSGPLLAQIFMASTYPREVIQWDDSVKALVSFPQVLELMDSQLVWMQKLGDAFLAQQKDTKDAIQRVRAKAQQPPESYWYYCPSARAYYPTARACPEPWIKVPPRSQ